MFIRTPYNYDVDEVSRETGFFDTTESLTQQSFKEECDINTLVRRFGITGQMPAGLVPPTYQLFEDVFDFRTAMDSIRAADEVFMQLPAELRARFGNDAGAFVDFCSDGKNIDELRRLGLAVPAPVVDNTPAVVKPEE